jgi:hypothetical protein
MMVEDIDPKSWLTREIYARFGRAMYHAQMLEFGIVNLAMWTGIRDRTVTSFEEADADSAALFRQTMGKLKTTLLERQMDVQHLEADLGRGVKLRNFLAHEYFRHRGRTVSTEDSQRMIEELERAAAFFTDLDSRLEVFTFEILRLTGVDVHMQEAMDSVRGQGFGPPLPGL